MNSALRNFRITARSPAIDAGSATEAPGHDLDGRQRPLDGNLDGSAVIDMGAFEYERPRISAFLVAGTEGTLTWPSFSGVVYRVLYATNLIPANWTSLVPDLTASQALSSVTDTNAGTAIKFYSVRQVE